VVLAKNSEGEYAVAHVGHLKQTQSLACLEFTKLQTHFSVHKLHNYVLMCMLIFVLKDTWMLIANSCGYCSFRFF